MVSKFYQNKKTSIVNNWLKTGLIILFSLSLGSCRKDVDPLDNIKSLDDIKVPSGFLWETARYVDFNISINDLKFLDDLHLISIYDKDPVLGGSLLAKGSVTLADPFQTKIYLPSNLVEVYIIKTAPDNTQIAQKVEVKSLKVDVVVSNSSAIKVMSSRVKAMLNIGSGGNKIAEEDCNAGCTQTITSSNSNINVNTGDVICVTGNNITISFNANGGVIKICGSNVNIQNGNLNNSSKLIISKTGGVVIGNLNLNGSSVVLENHGIMNFPSSSFSVGGSILNNGVMTVSGDFSLNSNSNLTNNKVINVGNFNVNTANETINIGEINVSKNLRLNSNSRFVNHCKVTISENLDVNSVFNNYSFVKVLGRTTVNGSNTLNFHNNSMLSTNNLTLNGSIVGNGETSLVKVAGNTTINGSGIVKGSLQLCDENGIETNYGKIIDGALRTCSVYIPKSDCNSEGNGVALIKDTDGDGISDLLDEYPDDKTKAFNNYYPSASVEKRSTLMFEDSWPTKGDYDLNDVVISYRYKIVTNAKNEVVQVNGDYLLKATGGGFANGFAVEFPTKSSQIGNVTGGTLEAGHENAVIVVFQNMRQEMENWNTKDTEPVSNPIPYQISFDNTSGLSLREFGLGAYNPFIINNTTGFGRGYEVHLPGKKPTILANKALFGTKDDDTKISSDKYYLTVNQLPWAINISDGNFNYTKEEVSIFKAYLKFPAWAQSGGALFTDWYINKSKDYLDESLLYKPR